MALSGVNPIATPTPLLARSVGMASRILIVDDNPHFRRTACELFAMRGFELVAAVDDGDSALAGY